MISVFKILTKDLLRHPDITWDLAIISQDIEELSDAFLFIIDTTRVYQFVQHLRIYSISYEAYIKPGRSVRIISRPEKIYTYQQQVISQSLANY
jgi:hypothetical protein